MEAQKMKVSIDKQAFIDYKLHKQRKSYALEITPKLFL